MDPSLRVVMRMPVEELWDCTGTLPATRRRYLGHTDVAQLLLQGRIRYVVADIGSPLTWIAPSSCYEFWKSEVKPRIVETATFDQAESPGAYCYAASEWNDGRATPLVLLEMYH